MSNDLRDPEFDRYAQDYDALLRDPIRDRFAGGSAFFFERKWWLLQEYLAASAMDSSKAAWLDVGCGRGELLRLGGAAFGDARGCDLSTEMIRAAADLNVTIQPESTRLPFEDASFDLITAVCVYHHVALADRDALTSEISRLLRPHGAACIIEHNPFNPATQLIVHRTPVDRDAKLLTAGATRRLLAAAGLQPEAARYFLYFPEKLYRRLKGLEGALDAIPLGGQYAVFARKP